MKKNICLLILSMIISLYTYAQHEHHKPQKPAKQTKPTNKKESDKKTISPQPKNTEKHAIPENKDTSEVINQQEEKVNQVPGKRIVYHLYVADTLVNFAGKTKKAIAINGQIPAPTLYFTQGDTAEVHVHNTMHHETSIHWHGILLPNEQDGVSYLTTAPIKAHSTHIFEFPIRQNGTYWYHSHTMLQEQIGMYGALILNKKVEKEKPKLPEHILVLSEWTNENPHQVERSLHYATDWYAIKKRATQNYAQAIKEGHFKTKFTNEWKRMLAMDVSDIWYNQFLINGKKEENVPNLKPGEQVRLRVINGGASSYFWLTYSGGKITVVAHDGNDVVPVEVDRLIIGVAETVDILVTLPHKGIAHEFVATAEDRTGRASLWLGQGVKQLESPLPQLKYFEGMKMMNDMMTLGGNMKEMGMSMSWQQMDMNTVMYPEITSDAKNKQVKPEENAHAHHTTTSGDIVTLNYAMLKSPVKTTLPNAPLHTLHFELTGNMNRFVWTIDNKKVSETDKILIKGGENYRFIIRNNSMMRHPMHLHGHEFLLLNGHGEYAPRKNVLDVMPMEIDTIDFHASEKYGNWFFHCHNIYHMMSGMGRILTYENSPPNPQIPDPEKAIKKLFRDDRRFFLKAEIGLESNGSDGEILFSNTRWIFQNEWRLGLNDSKGYETESHFGRFIDNKQFLFVYAGWDFRYRKIEEPEKNLFGQTNTKNRRQAFEIGLQYTLPWFVVAEFRTDHTGNLRLQLSRDDIPVTSRLRLRGSYNSDMEYSIGARYIVTKYFSLSSHYDSDMGLGAGLTITY